MTLSDRLLVCVDIAGDILLKYLGPALVCFGFGLIGLIAITAFTFLIPLVSESSPIAYALYSLLGILILFNIVHNYLSAVFISPGFVCDAEAENLESSQHSVSDELNRLMPPHNGVSLVGAGSETVSRPNMYTYCRICDSYRPERAHHCSACGRCVLRMDHHCPWINNCVGQKNYKYFVKFLFHIVVGCFFSVYLSCKPFFMNGAELRQRSIHLFQGVEVPLDIAINLSFVLCLSCTVAVGFLLSCHVYLILTNQTTIEFYGALDRRKQQSQANGQQHPRNRYRKDSHQNWEEVFGPTRYRQAFHT